MKELNDMQKTILYDIYEGFAGACSLRQVLMLDEVTQKDIDELSEAGYLRTQEIGDKQFVICRHSVFSMAGNGNQNYRLTAYNLKKSCLLAEFWIEKQNIRSIWVIEHILTQGTMHQQSLGPWEGYLSELHTQGCYEWFTIPEEHIRYMILFPKSHNPLTLSKAIKKFFDNQAKFSDIDEIQPHLSVCVPNDRVKEAVLKRIDGRYWWIHDRLEIFTLECPDTLNMI